MKIKIFSLTGEQRDELLLMLISIVMGVFTLWMVLAKGMMYFDADTRSHLNVARMVLDNITPGFNQLGIWNPLLHILLQPYIVYWPFFETGVAGFCLLLPCLFLSAVFLRRIIMQLTESRRLSFIGGLLLILHPYSLFFASVPMTELLQMTCILGASYFLTLWLRSPELRWMLYCGIFAALACMARFESLGLSLAIAIIIAVQTYKGKKSLSEIFALMQLFWLVAILGIAYLVAYGTFYLKGPLAFLGLSQGSPDIEPKTLYFTLQLFSHGLMHLHGLILLIAPLCFIPVLLYFWRAHREIIYILFVLANPFIVVFYALYTKSSLIIWVPELPRLNEGPPIGFFAGIRFLLSSTPFLLATLMLGIHVLESHLGRLRPAVMRFITTACLVMFCFVQLVRIWTVADAAFPAMQKGQDTKKAIEYHVQIANFLREHYDYGIILYFRNFSDIVQYHAQLPLKKYMYTANYPYFDQAIRYPWLFTRWVVLPTNLPPNAQLYIDLKNSDDFNKYFERVFSVPKTEKLVGFTIYRLREDIVREEMRAMQINVDKVPALMHETSTWDSVHVNDVLNLQNSPWYIEQKFLH